MLEYFGMQDSFISDQPRYERKFLLNTLQSVGLNQLIKLNPAGFREAYAPRRINNIYYDTSDFSHFRENIAGVSPRKKVRVRWYGQFDEIKSPVLEIKSKTGEVVTKSSHVVTSISTETINTFFNTVNYQPVLKNSYLRQYFISADKTVRLTIDTQVEFSGSNSVVSQAPDKQISATIVELKYALSEEEQAIRVASSLPFRLTKSSKYEQGVSLCYPHLVIV
jgi:SPX domain protein involved in polyphosphate accumulation